MSLVNGVNTAALKPNTLFLLFTLSGERYALAATEVVEVLPCLPLKPLAGTPAWVAGVFAHRGTLVPVVDLAILAFGTATPRRTSTRLVVVNYQHETERRWLGLLLEQATDTLRCPAHAFRPSPVSNRAAPYLGPILETERGLVQRIQVTELLDGNVCAVLFPSDSGGASA